ncbi:hypothetical protein BGX29_001390 [Mortierella sp. GBA35]|nr:hypothetical protein BGX29_001390 [Mortierella sp. GBA35]
MNTIPGGYEHGGHGDVGLPLYFHFIISRRSCLDSIKVHQQINIDLGHGFRLTLVGYHNDNNIDIPPPSTPPPPIDNDDEDPPLSDNTTVVSPDTTTTTTTTTASPTTTHTAMSDMSDAGYGQHPHRIGNTKNLSELWYNTVANSHPADLLSASRQTTSDDTIDSYRSTTLAITLTLARGDNLAKEYASMIQAVHLYEIDEDGERLYLSKAIDGSDLIRHGVSILLDVDDVLTSELSTFGILLSLSLLELLVPQETIARSASEPFGRFLLISFLLHTSSADVVYAPLTASNINNSNKPRHHYHYQQQQQQQQQQAKGTHGQTSASTSSSSTPPIHAHSAVMRQWPAFDGLLRRFPRPDDYPKVHKLIDIDTYAMRLVVNFVYLGKIEGPGYTGLVDWRHIFQLAHRFKISRLLDMALEELCKTMKVGTVLPTLFQWAYQHPEYEDRLLEYLVEHLDDRFEPTLETSLEPFRGHPEYIRIRGKLLVMKAAMRGCRGRSF